MCFAVFPQSYSITTFVPRFSTGPSNFEQNSSNPALGWLNSENSLIHPAKLQQTAFSIGLAETKPGRTVATVMTTVNSEDLTF